MENLDNAFTVPLFLTGIIFIIVSLILMKFPPKKINQIYGYRTSNSMKSQEHWDFAQQYSAKIMLKSGLAIILISFFGYFIADKSSSQLSIYAIFILLIPVAIMFFKTENAIKQRFGEQE
jgi:uncharacterized membrane protein